MAEGVIEVVAWKNPDQIDVLIRVIRENLWLIVLLSAFCLHSARSRGGNVAAKSLANRDA